MYLLFGFLAVFRLYLRFRGKKLSSTLLRICHKNGNFVDVSRLYQWPKGQPSQFNDDAAYLSA
jgi:hypothetical protein